MTQKALSDIRRKLKVLTYAQEIGNVPAGSAPKPVATMVYPVKHTINGNGPTKNKDKKDLSTISLVQRI